MKKKKYLGIHFECCNVYRRVYVNKELNAYEGRCPICLRTVKVKIGAEGTDTRFFLAR